MKYNIKKEKGITMISLVITVLIILILTNMLIYNAKDNIHIKRLTDLYNDISNLREKVSTYYNEYGKIPAEIQYTNTSGLSNILSNQNDIGDFYVIDLEAMQGITLNYGRDYEKLKNDKENANNYTDLYIINENSHNIFYVEGIEIEENNTTKTYYTDYIEPDETSIDLRYIDGILIPDDYYYIGKIKDNSGNENIVISNIQGETLDTTKTHQYTWIKQISEIEKKPESVKLEDNQKEYEYIESVNTYKGYFKNSEGKVQYLIIDEEKWSEAYTKDTEYKDKKGDKVTIPQGFKVSMAPTMNIIEKGLVVKDSNENEWVWVVVPDSVFTTAINNSDYDNIKADLIRYTKDYRKENSTQNFEFDDEWYEGCGIADITTYTKLYNEMLSSVYTNKGFWISRYEAGIDGSDIDTTQARTSHTNINENSMKAVSKANMIPYNYITCGEAQMLAKAMSKGTNKTGSLLFGIQWDLVCKFLEENSNLQKEDINSDSTSWGNYTPSQIGNIKLGTKQLISSEWKRTTEDKLANKSVLLTTGASIQTKKLNICDLAGNEWEWTLEKITKESYSSSARGGYFYTYNEMNFPASYRGYNSPTYSDESIGFRTTLY